MLWDHPRNAGTMSLASIGCRDRCHLVAACRAFVAGVLTRRAAICTAQRHGLVGANAFGAKKLPARKVREFCN